MTKGFWITSIGVYGHDTKPDSFVRFQKGLNVLYGASNSGKSWVLACIDYMFGASSKTFVIDESLGYRRVGMSVQTARGKITLRRPIGEGQGTIEVVSSDPWIVSGDYKINPSARTIALSYLWLRLIGFEKPEEVMVITNKEMALKALTWRTFWHALYADEDNIPTKHPILLPEQATARTGFKSALATLITGEDFAAYADRESPKSQKMKNNAIIDYLETLEPQYRERIKNVDAVIGNNPTSKLEEQIHQLSDQANQIQQAILEWSQQGKRTHNKLQQTREKLSETASLLSRYQELSSTYQARIARFDFVVDGHQTIDQYHISDTCPVCSQNLPQHLQEEFSEPNIREREGLQARLHDLNATMEEITNEQNTLREDERNLTQEAKRITSIINADLNPQLKRLQKAIKEYRAVISLQAEREEIVKQQEATAEEIARRKALSFPKVDFNPTDHLPEDFWEGMDTVLLDILGACAFPRLREARFDRTDFDAVVNKKAKAKEGQGYRSFVNTTVLLSLQKYLGSSHSAYNPGILIIDTPLLGLDDPQLDPELAEVRETIPSALYDYLATEQEAGQIIIVDNTKFMPDIASIENRCHLIRFTKQVDVGRYGFLMETTDEDLTDQEQNNDDDN